MAELLELEVVTPARSVLKEQAESVIVPTPEGLLGILRNHAPLVAGLDLGILQFGPERGQKKQMVITGGFLEVRDNKVTVLADSAELAEEIDLARAQKARARAARRLRTYSDQIDYIRAEAALNRALTRLKVAGGP